MIKIFRIKYSTKKGNLIEGLFIECYKNRYLNVAIPESEFTELKDSQILSKKEINKVNILGKLIEKNGNAK